jgi:cell wall assembly regulator SMI1
MAGMKRLKRGDCWSEDELKILGLLLEGDTSLLACLRRQITPPFCRWVERMTPTMKIRSYRTAPTDYAISVVYDDLLRNEFSAGAGVSLVIDDLTIVEPKMKRELQVIGRVRDGILTQVRFIAPEAVKWPKTIGLADWHFTCNGQRTQHRVCFDKLDLAVQRITVAGLPDSWVKDLLAAADAEGVPVSLWPGADPATVSLLEEQAGDGLPPDYLESLRVTNGASVWRTKVFGTSEAYLLEAEGLPSGRFLVISTDEAGDVVALDLFHADGSRGTSPVVHLYHDTGEMTHLAPSFREWLARLVADAIEGASP